MLLPRVLMEWRAGKPASHLLESKIYFDKCYNVISANAGI